MTNTTVNMADYTLLVYMIGSDLESQHFSATKDLIEMRAATTENSSNINVIVQTGGAEESQVSLLLALRDLLILQKFRDIK
jgi:hypothetical protein